MLEEILLEKFTESNYPKVLPKKCVRIGNNTCDICIKACPKEAIYSDEKSLGIDENRCKFCGICKAVCPFHAINMKGLGEENIIRTIKEKEKIVFSCSNMGGIGTLKLNCLHGFHPELIASIFIQYDEKPFYFNISKCKTCENAKAGSDLLIESIQKAEKLAIALGKNPRYEIVADEGQFKDLTEGSLSRRDLFSLFRKGSKSLATQVIDTLVSDKEEYISFRKMLIGIVEKDINIDNSRRISKGLLNPLKVNESCNGCGKCVEACVDGAWCVDKDSTELGIKHNTAKCYGCNRCMDICPQNAIENDTVNVYDINKYRSVGSISLSTCSLCNNGFVQENEENECSVCKKKAQLRSRLAGL